METVMAVVLPALGWTLFAVAVLAGLILDLAGLFGNWVILAAAAAAWAVSGFAHFGVMTLALMAGIAVLGEALEFLFSGYGAKRFGGDKGTMGAAIVGCLAGAVMGTPVFPVIGSLAGACAGAFLGAALYDYLQRGRRVNDALRAGFGAALGRIGGLLAKFCCGLAMLAAAFMGL